MLGFDEPRSAQAPDWLLDALRSALDELRLFARTLWAITARPEAFARSWADRSARAANPLAFLATCASIVAALIQGMQLLGFQTTGESVSLSEQVLNTTGPFLQYAAAGVISHAFLLPVRPRRRLLDSLAIGLYAGGPALCGYALVITVMAIVWFFLGRPPLTSGLATMPSAWGYRLYLSFYLVVFLFARSLSLGLAGLRAGRRIVCGLATVAAMTVLAVVFGKIDVHGPYGIQLVVSANGGHLDWGLHD